MTGHTISGNDILIIRSQFDNVHIIFAGNIIHFEDLTDRNQNWILNQIREKEL